ncbi:DUF1178 family protein [Elioraea sp.]|uniref:DUF1178 family protein n=1 Tax=Elioraea sp. TaxID=2185103 RepID=UPI003F6FFC2A
MIHYALRCDSAHEFDGWFKDSAAFERMAKRGLVECPECGSAKVARALMAPAVTSSRAPAAPAPPPTQPAPAEGKAIAGQMPAAALAILQRMRAEIEKHCDYVGPRFADEARKIHAGESDARGIYGEATTEDAEALRDEGIGFSTIPWVPRADG